MTLRDCRPGHAVRLRRLDWPAEGRRLRLRLTELGFLRGTWIKVIARGAAGGVVVAVGDARVALDARTAEALIVEPIDDRPPAAAAPTAAAAAAPTARPVRRAEEE